MIRFDQLGLAAPLLRVLQAEGYTEPTPIQAKAIPLILEGRDLLGIAATGTGKTAAYALPLLQRLAAANRSPARRCRALILSPTRELAAQIAASVKTYGGQLQLRAALIIGGVPPRAQSTALAKGADIVIATPGRLLDHIERGALTLADVETFILDEADHMLDLGFMPAVRRIVRMLPPKRQNLFFSATMPKEIAKLASDILRQPTTVTIAPSGTSAEGIDQRVLFVETDQKAHMLTSILREKQHDRVLVFTRTKRGADRVVRHLGAARLPAAAIHGNKSQGQRERALAEFKSARAPVLVATDIAARGIDIDGVGLVVNFDLPHVAETYVHRIGRTARAGASGSAIAFCASDERPLLRAIETLMRRRIEQGAASGEASRQPARREHNPPTHGSDKENGHGHRRQATDHERRGAEQSARQRPASRTGGKRASAGAGGGADAAAHGRDRGPQNGKGRQHEGQAKGRPQAKGDGRSGWQPRKARNNRGVNASPVRFGAP